MACYEDQRTLCAATAKERDELRKENAELEGTCQKQAEMNGRVAAMALELDTMKAERDALLRIVKRAGDCNLCQNHVAKLLCAEDAYTLCESCGHTERVPCCSCIDGSEFVWVGLENKDENFAVERRLEEGNAID